MTKRHQMLCAQARNPEPGKAWMYVVVLVALGCVAAPASAQNCTAGNPQLAVAVLQTVLASCSSHDDFQAMESKYGYDVILVQASVAGNLAVPVLRQFASLPKNNECTSSNFGATARTALAKFGDETAYATVKKQWAQHRAGPYPARIDFIGDDWALQTLVEFLIQHANDPRMVVQHGPADGPEDYRSRILAQIRGIARRHAIPDLPDADYSPSGIAQWKAWLGKYKGQHLSTPVFESVSDPYLQCLARRVEWGHPDAVLDIATFGGPAAEAILKQFPAPRSGEVMGARELYRDVLRDENEDESRPNPDSEIQGNLQAALLRFGDQKTAGQVATELNSFAFKPGNFPLEAIRKLRFAGGKTAVGVLIDGLGSSNRMSQDAQKNFDACVVTVAAANQPWKQPKAAAEKACAGSFSWAERRTSLILSALAEMVKDPPLPANAPPTAENSQKWKDWWVKNRDKAVFVIPPRASYDWH
ncbi:MAG: hypothetical protein ABR881_21625 [Candidatus Sulfotelmatobacter sp.]